MLHVQYLNEIVHELPFFVNPFSPFFIWKHEKSLS